MMIKEVYFLDFFNSLAAGDKYNCARIIETLISESTDIKEIYTDLFQRSLYRIGKMWEQNQLSIAEEHATTQIIESLMGMIQLKYTPASQNGKKVIVSCVDKEFHLIGARMVAHIFELNGWDVTFLGASTPTREMIKLIDQKKPVIVGLSFNFYLNYLRLIEEIDNIKKNYPNQKILIGGQGMKNTDDSILKKYDNLFYFDSVDELDSYLKQVN